MIAAIVFVVEIQRRLGGAGDLRIKLFGQGGHLLPAFGAVDDTLVETEVAGGDVIHQHLAEFLKHFLHRLDARILAVLVGFEPGHLAVQRQHFGPLGNQFLHRFLGDGAAFRGPGSMLCRLFLMFRCHGSVFRVPS